MPVPTEKEEQQWAVDEEKGRRDAGEGKGLEEKGPEDAGTVGTGPEAVETCPRISLRESGSGWTGSASAWTGSRNAWTGSRDGRNPQADLL